MSASIERDKEAAERRVAELKAALRDLLEHAKDRDRLIPMAGTIAACKAALSGGGETCRCVYPDKCFCPKPAGGGQPK